MEAAPLGSGPTLFGRVYEAQRSAVVRVRARTLKAPWVAGVVIGARGEILFFAPKMPTPQLEIEDSDGKRHEARLLGFDRASAVAVGRVEAGIWTPPPVATEPLSPERWVVTLRHDSRGQLLPHAGVLGRLERGLVWADVPGRPGAPIFTVEGQLLGVATDYGNRRTRVRPLADLLPFLKAVVRANE